MAVYSKEIIDEAAGILNDVAFSYWTSGYHLDSLNSGQLQIALLKPDASTTAKAYQLAAGVRQGLPDGSASYQDPAAATLPAGLKLVRLVMNMGTTGLVPGRAISIIDMDMLSSIRPTWPADSASAVVKHFMYDEKDPKSFWVSPPQPASSQGYVLALYNAVPADVASYASNAAISLADEFRPALLNWILFKAYARDTDEAHSNRALQYYDAFLQVLNLSSAIERAEDPNYKDKATSASY